MYLTGAPDQSFVKTKDAIIRPKGIGKNQMNDSYGRFRCIHCGGRFNLNDEENEVYEQGFYVIDPNCCDDCYNNLEHAPDNPEFSDADPGL